MTVAKVLEILAESNESWEAAIRDGVQEAAKTVNGIKSVYASEFQAIVEDNKVVKFRVNCKITFVVHE